MYTYSQTSLRQTAPAPKPEPKRRPERPAVPWRPLAPETVESNARFTEMFLRGDRIEDIRIAFGYRASGSVSARAKRLGLPLRTSHDKHWRADTSGRDEKFTEAWMNPRVSLHQVMLTVGFKNAGSALRLARRLGLPLRRWDAAKGMVVLVPRDATGGSK